MLILHAMQDLRLQAGNVASASCLIQMPRKHARYYFFIALPNRQSKMPGSLMLPRAHCKWAALAILLLVQAAHSTGRPSDRFVEMDRQAGARMGKGWWAGWTGGWAVMEPLH